MVQQITSQLQALQQNVSILQRQASFLGTRQDVPAFRDELALQINVLGDLEQRVTAQLKRQQTEIEEMPRPQAARRRATHVKLKKDFERVCEVYHKLVGEIARKQSEITIAIEDGEQVDPDATGEDHPGHLKVAMRGQDVDEAIMKERQDEIRQINNDMHLINSMYKDLAEIVTDQQEDIDEIEESTHIAHERAEQGLQQVQQAADYQTTCILS